jgi:hypothetical protein
VQIIRQVNPVDDKGRYNAYRSGLVLLHETRMIYHSQIVNEGSEIYHGDGLQDDVWLRSYSESSDLLGDRALFHQYLLSHAS